MATVEYCALGYCLPSAEWASWVQAVGSVLAILAAIGIATWQRHQDRVREDVRERKKSFQQMEALVTLAAHTLFLIEAVPSAGVVPTIYEAYLELKHPTILVSGSALQKFGPEHVPDGSALVHTLGLIRCAGEAQGEREKYEEHFWREGASMSPEQIEKADKTLADIKLRASASFGMLRYIQGKYFKPQR